MGDTDRVGEVVEVDAEKAVNAAENTDDTSSGGFDDFASLWTLFRSVW